MKICPNSINELRKLADIIEIIGGSGCHLERSEQNPEEYWSWWRFSGEAGITLKVNDEKQKWFCFNLRKGGDVFQFVMKDKGIDHEEAVAWVAEHYKFKLNYVSPTASEGRTSMSAPTLVLISGFARAGKDTLASGILEWSTRPSRKTNFADYLKDAGNDFLMSLNLEGNFHDDRFKTLHRDFLVAGGRLARSLDVNIFAKNLANFCPIQMAPGELAPETVVCSDLRYANEVAVCQDVLIDLGWKVRTIYVATAGIGPANQEEMDSILEIREKHAFDLELTFAPNTRNTIMQEGRYIAKTWRL